MTNRAISHLTFIDGMRGFAALYVVFFHAVQDSHLNPIPFWYYFLSQGHTMVTIFIVISGFCLMLPVAKNGLTLLPDGKAGFFRKRAYRILPPYYLALGIGILAEAFSYPWTKWTTYFREPSTTLALWTHLFMVHNWFPSAQFRFDGPLWSVAMECQIYLLFPLIVAAWRRFGPVPTLIVVGILAHAGYYWKGHTVALNYFFIFTLGMLGADLAVRNPARPRRWIQWSCGASLVGYLLLIRSNKVYITDILVGVFAAMLMAALTLGNLSSVRSGLSGRVIAWFGSFSYSIYLIHAIVQWGYLRTPFAANLANKPLKQILVLSFGITPGVIVVSYFFYLVAEKPSIDLAKNSSKRANLSPVSPPF